MLCMDEDVMNRQAEGMYNKQLNSKSTAGTKNLNKSDIGMLSVISHFPFLPYDPCLFAQTQADILSSPTQSRILVQYFAVTWVP